MEGFFKKKIHPMAIGDPEFGPQPSAFGFFSVGQALAAYRGGPPRTTWVPRPTPILFGSLHGGVRFT